MLSKQLPSITLLGASWCFDPYNLDCGSLIVWLKFLKQFKACNWTAWIQASALELTTFMTLGSCLTKLSPSLLIYKVVLRALPT